MHRLLGTFELIVLQSLISHQEIGNGAQYGAALARDMARVYPTSTGAVTSTLDRLEAQGLLRSAMKVPKVRVKGSRARRYFSITQEGHREVQMTKAILKRIGV